MKNHNINRAVTTLQLFNDLGTRLMRLRHLSFPRHVPEVTVMPEGWANAAL